MSIHTASRRSLNFELLLYLTKLVNLEKKLIFAMFAQISGFLFLLFFFPRHKRISEDLLKLMFYAKQNNIANYGRVYIPTFCWTFKCLKHSWKQAYWSFSTEERSRKSQNDISFGLVVSSRMSEYANFIKPKDRTIAIHFYLYTQFLLK
jgi:hypothetical protein